jgi:hypothetical protein
MVLKELKSGTTPLGLIVGGSLEHPEQVTERMIDCSA